MSDDLRMYVGPNERGTVPDFISDELREQADEDGYVPLDAVENRGDGVLVPA